jgi:tetratricopeptide (TPR) repeat protein
MQRPRIALGLICLTLGVFAACGPSEEKVAAQKQQENQQKLEELQQQHDALVEKRSQLAEDKARLAAGAEENGGETPSAEGTAEAAAGGEAGNEMTQEELAAEVDRLEKEVEEDAGAFYQALTEFINEDVPIIQGEPMSDIQKAAVRMKSDEEMLMAHEYIEAGGDYKRAISIYQQALIADPDNAELQAALEKAESLRFMTEERLSQVKKGMNEDEVRELLGQPNLYNVKEYEKQGVTAWYYPTNEQGAAAAVWFRPRHGEHQVYKTDFNAVAGRTDEEGSE